MKISVSSAITLATFHIPLLGLALAVAPVIAAAQSNVIYLSPAPKPMTVQDVIKLSKAGLSDNLIIQQIRKNNQHFVLSTDQLIQLKTASVSERVIQVMIDPTVSAPVPAPTAKTSTPPAAAAPVLQASRQVDPPGSAMPTEIGVYAKSKDGWTEVLPEVVNWKSGGVVKNTASLGVVKEDLNGHVNGSTSRNRLTTPIQFVIVAPEGIAITEYQLIRFHQHGGDREFRTVTGGVFHVSGGATRDLRPFDGTKIAPRTYAVNFSADTGAGEYGFLPPSPATANAASSGKIYSFEVIE